VRRGPPTQAPHPSEPAPAPTASPSLRAHFGVDAANRLLRSSDPAERLRGLERAAAIRTPEALTLLERAASPATPGGFDPRAPVEGVARKDPRALLVVVRALATWTSEPGAREALAGILDAATQSFLTQVATSQDPATAETVGLARLRLAREQAAIALALSGHPLALESLLASARGGGPAQEPALEALAMFPPASTLFGGVALTTPPTIALAAQTGDLRVLDAIQGVLAASDPAVRAAAFAALGLAGDARVQPAARLALKEPDARVRVAAAEALAELGAPDAGPAVEALVGDPATAREGLRLAQVVQSTGVTRAAAARAAASADDATRAAALVALGRQTDPAAVEALVALVSDARLGGDAADALARSPSPGAMAALEKLAAAAPTRRLALRAYFVRRTVRGERSLPLEAHLAAAVASADPVDRALAVQILVALGQRPLASALADPDPRVQRGGAMGALALPPSERARAVAVGLPVVRDEPARQVLAFLLDEADDTVASTRDLLDRARSGAADAPLAAMALARRSSDELAEPVDALLASSDPVLRAHVARGLGASATSDATGRLARAYDFETDVEVRRALIRALASRTQDEQATYRREALALAARLDPDRITRDLAARAEAGEPLQGTAAMREVAWLRLVAAPGASLPPATTGTVTGVDGLARPVVFDDDGYALVGGLPPGQALLRLASRSTAYQSP
jgi:HEAT repeat protein